MKNLISLAFIAIAFINSSVEAASCSPVYGQCGGVNWTGPKCCVAGSTCVAQSGNKWYSQCLPSTQKPATTTTKKPVATKTTTKAPTTTNKPTTPSKGYSVIPGGVSGSGETTRYWDCCKSSCSWPGKASVSSPIDTCAKNGISLLDDNTQSGCGGGAGFVCNNNQPWAVNDNLAYGYAAARLEGSSEARWCCGCLELTFTSSTAAGKKMVVQITNTGDDAGTEHGNHFDIQIPGGGVGQFNGCSAQWGAPSSGWGARYGGVSSLSECNQLPAPLQPGCKWRFGWFKGADNPTVTFKEVTCPAEIVARTGCQRK